MRASSAILFCMVAVTGCYIFSFPYYGTAFDINTATSSRLGLPLSDDHKCNVKSDSNTSLLMAYASGSISLLITILLTVFALTPRNTEGWSVNIVWITSTITLIFQLLVFTIIVARISVWFLSCTNPSKIEASCPTTRYKELRGPITDVEQCNFHPVTLTLFQSENDLFLDCLNEIEFTNYNAAFGRYDVPAYYTSMALCLRNETGQLGLDLSWCYYYGCSRTCNNDMYMLNAKWFALDIALLVLILVAYIIVMSEFYVQKGIKRS